MKKRFLTIEVLLVFLCFSVCLAGALLLPVNQCPDEGGRLSLIEWIVKTGTLPTGDEPETMLPGWGFSYALRPFLSSMIGAGFQILAACFTDSPRSLLAAARMGSVLSVTGCCVYCLRLGHRLFERRSSAVLLAAVVCFLPQVMYLGMYHNNDAISLFAVCMMLYYWVEGYDRKWPAGSCAGLGVAFSLGLLSYYSIYGWILMCVLFCAAAVLTDPKIPGKGQLILRRAALIAGICVLLAGWFFIRNACLHHGDFLGIASENISRAHMQMQGYELHKAYSFRDEGLSVLQFLRLREYEWLRYTLISFFGMFGYWFAFLPKLQYGIYCTVFLGAILLFFAMLLHRKTARRDSFLMLLMLFSGMSTVALHFWQSYTRDYQPQGRYVISLIVPLAFMMTYGLDKTIVKVQNPKPGKAAELNPAAALAVLWLILFAWAALGTMIQMIR